VQKFIVDIAGKLPTIIAEYSDPNSFTNSYIYADGQILARYTHNADETVDENFYYVHDRLGSVRMVVGYDGADAYVENHYTYAPFGQTLQSSENTYNPFQFTGQWCDQETSEYYLRARQYDPTMMRFTTRDPVKGKMEEPLTLHKYLYCGNDGINRVDLDGRWAIVIGGSVSWNVGGMGTDLISKTTKASGILAGALARSAVIGGLATQIAYSTAGTAGLGTAFGYGEDGGFIGSVFFAAGGIQQGDFVGGVQIDYAWSPNAQSLQDLAGGFVEVGGSGGPFGGSVSKGIGTDIYLITGSIGWGVGTHEVHAYVGHTWVEEW